MSAARDEVIAEYLHHRAMGRGRADAMWETFSTFSRLLAYTLTDGARPTPLQMERCRIARELAQTLAARERRDRIHLNEVAAVAA
jgi:hypothetical protein